MISAVGDDVDISRGSSPISGLTKDLYFDHYYVSLFEAHYFE
jgi:hypothetical protein